MAKKRENNGQPPDKGGKAIKEHKVVWQQKYAKPKEIKGMLSRGCSPSSAETAQSDMTDDSMTAIF